MLSFMLVLLLLLKGYLNSMDHPAYPILTTKPIKTREAEHLQNLVSQMEATPGQDEMNKVQIADLKAELAKSEESLKIRTEELLQVRKDLRTKDEEIQQREIDISCLRGQVE